jgi:signal transduction histidine kinase
VSVTVSRVRPLRFVRLLSWRPWLLPALIALAGLAATGLAAAAGRLALADAAGLATLAAGGAVLAGVLAAVLLVLVRRSSLTAQTVVAGLAPVLAVAIGVAGASSAMFISRHDVHVLLVVLVAAGTAGLLTGLSLGRRLAEAQDRASAVERSRRELVAWVSDDLRAPLSGIRAMAGALEEAIIDDTETVSLYHRTIRQEADRLAALIEDLLELSRIHSGVTSPDPSRVALHELVSDALARASIAASAKGIDLRGAVGDPSPMVELAGPEMARAVRNLLDDAIRHTPTGGTIWVEAALDEAGTSAVVSVLDACGGMPERHVDQVFDMAYGDNGSRGDRMRPTGDGGGVELAVAREVVETDRGRISAGKESQGCRFTVRLALAGPASALDR